MASIATFVCLPLAAALVIAGCSGDDDVEFRPGCVTSSDCALGDSCDPVSGACVVTDPPQPIEPAPTPPSDPQPDAPTSEAPDAGTAPGTAPPPRCDEVPGSEDRDDDCKDEDDEKPKPKGKHKHDKDKDKDKDEDD